ncbi:hypothetical protein [Geodermatophilus sp. DSM 44513]|uniref:hypothetical protein n=1 Tax=Geodermatophilus sp. DSM 44513 TaxID=1528104 RepID=UPI001283D4CD|nr:hypothetical protein [Geodermatophilus sp. DSM 44513]WNV74175.1 hypothetical protein RTG05_14385 [Geodermatophilus sp. DSM 44513]
MSAATEAEQELSTMLDEGVTVRLVDTGDGVYQLHLAVDEAVCADCLVPDPTLVAIATDALARRGVPVAAMSVLRPAAHA